MKFVQLRRVVGAVLVAGSSLLLPVMAVHGSPDRYTCQDRPRSARCNDLRHFANPASPRQSGLGKHVNEHKCNDMRHFGSFAHEQYNVVCNRQ